MLPILLAVLVAAIAGLGITLGIGAAFTGGLFWVALVLYLAVLVLVTILAFMLPTRFLKAAGIGGILGSITPLLGGML